MDRAAYTSLLARARRLSRGPEEAADLLHDTLLVAVGQGRTDMRADAAWLAGVMRRQAALRARTEVRRRWREGWAAAQAEVATAPPDPVEEGGRAFLAALSPASRRMAVLVLHGLGPVEIGWLLGLGPAALRQRVVRLRRSLEGLDPVLRAQAMHAARQGPMRCANLASGSLRRALRAALRGPALGTHDPDGHLLVVRSGHA